MRIDKFIANLGYGSRKQVIDFIKDGYITVNDNLVLNKDYEVNYGDKIGIGEEEIIHKEFIYVALNKPSGYVSSKKPEGGHKSYIDLIQDCPYSNILNVVGRLDFDTTGLLVLTNDGEFTHKMINPKKDTFKKYYVKSKNPISQKDTEKLQKGLKIDDYITKPSIVEKISENEIFLSISQGKFHQIKKMFLAINNEVIELKRVEIGDIKLGNLELGKWRYLDI